MSDEVRIWRVKEGDQLEHIPRAQLDLESRLQEWLARDISVLDSGLLVIGREVETDFGGFIDILCVNEASDLVIVELKRDKTPREITAQALDYASWVVNLSHDKVTAIAGAYLDSDLETAFNRKFGSDLPETLNGDHRVVIVASVIDASSERIIKYLSGEHGMNINAATFNYFRLTDGTELLARTFLIEPAEVDLKTRTLGSSKRKPRLTYDELAKQAAEAGVLELYQHALRAFEPLLQKYTTSSGIGFSGPLEGGRKSILSFTPGQSSEGRLNYFVYNNRFAELTGLAVADAEALLPHEHTSRSNENSPEYDGFEGHFTQEAEIDRLASPLRTALTAPHVPPAQPRSPETAENA